MKRTLPSLLLCLGTATWLLSACGDKPQNAGTQTSDAKAWQGAQPGFTASGWKAGDEASWSAQIKQRNRGQNEYARTAP